LSVYARYIRGMVGGQFCEMGGGGDGERQEYARARVVKIAPSDR